MRKYFSEDTRKAASEIVRNVLHEVEDTLTKATWMDKKTLANALKKARAIAPIIGYPEELLNSNNMEIYFNDLKLDSTNFLQNILRTNKFGTRKSLLKLREFVDKYDWTTFSYSAVFNAAYHLETNVICNSIDCPRFLMLLLNVYSHFI